VAAKRAVRLRVASFRDPERGSGGTSLGWVIAATAVLLLVLGGIQFGVHSYARSLALSAAQAGVRAAAMYPSSIDRGRAVTEEFLVVAGSSLQDTAVTVALTGQRVTVTVSGTSTSLVPGMTFTLTEQAAGPLEPAVTP
jgi:TadE-like protein